MVDSNKFKTFEDTEKYDHADEGVKLLFEEGLIEEFNIDKNHYEIIEYAIKYHNKYELKKCSDKRMLKMSKLIRDVDKIDILYQLGKQGIFKEKADDSKINPRIVESIKSHKTINWKDVKSNNDKLANRFGLAFDINNDMCLKEYKKYLNAYYKKIEKNDRFKEIYKTTLKYINERID